MGLRLGFGLLDVRHLFIMLSSQMLAAAQVLDVMTLGTGVLCNLWVCLQGQCDQVIVHQPLNVLKLVIAPAVGLSLPSHSPLPKKLT